MRSSPETTEPGRSIYRSAEAEAEALALYERRLAALPAEVERSWVQTGAGSTHVLVTGPESAPPLLAIHGAQYSGPFNLASLLPLASELRLYAPDVPGQFGRSAPTRLLPRAHAYGRWALEVLDALHLESVPVLGVSFGGAILLDLACLEPRRIRAAVLIVPAGITIGSPWRILRRLFLPWWRYRRNPSPERLALALEPLATESDEVLFEWLGTVIRTVGWRVPPPGPFRRKQLAAFDAPTFLAAAEDDVFFPRERLLRRAAKLLPGLQEIERLPGKHIPPRASFEALNHSIQSFLLAALPPSAREGAPNPPGS